MSLISFILNVLSSTILTTIFSIAVDFLSIQNTLITIPLGSGYQLSWIEAVATIFGLLCIWYASQAKLINFFFGIINVSLFAVIFYQIQLYGLLMLQVFFLLANIYGWYAWQAKNDCDETLEIRWLTREKRFIAIAFTTLAIAALTYAIDPVFQALTNAVISLLNGLGIEQAAVIVEPDAYPFWDASITIMSVVAQILMTRKYVENWLLWMVVNVISVGVYIAQGVYVLALEYTLVFFIAANGFRHWQRQAK